jgi:hypothetical protein
MIRTNCFLTFLALTFSACGHAQDPSPAPVTVVAQTEATSESPIDMTIGPCPIQWTCNHASWFTSNSACSTSSACAGQTCFLEEHDTGHCIPR